MTENEYRNHPAISRSQLWRLRESPEKFRYYEDNPQPPTSALLFGQAVHKLLLQPEDFDSEFAVAPEGLHRTAKKGWANFCEDFPNQTVITLEEYIRASEMVKAARQNALANRLLDGEHETPFFWTDELTQEPCKCRTDCITYVSGKPLIVDYKTARKASTRAFNKIAITNPDELDRESFCGYDVQAAMYSEGVAISMGLSEKPQFVFIVQEKDPPYSVNKIEVDELVMQNGYDIFRYLLGEYHYCNQSGNWYGYNGRDDIINNLSLPAWLARE